MRRTCVVKHMGCVNASKFPIWEISSTIIVSYKKGQIMLSRRGINAFAIGCELHYYLYYLCLVGEFFLWLIEDWWKKDVWHFGR